jgi:hypothetical protein
MINTKCSTGKKTYATETIAEDVLIELWTRFEYNENSAPLAVYKCDDCGLYHLTSRGPMNNKLAQYLSSNKAKLNKEANKWLDKFKNKY